MKRTEASRPPSRPSFRTRRAALALAPLFFYCLAPALAQISLGTVVELAERNSSQVKLADADLRKATASLAETKDAYIPNFVIGSSIGPPSIGFPASQPSIANASMQSLAFSLQQGRYIRAARAGVRAAELSLQDARDEVALEASSEYIELDTVARELRAAQEQNSFAAHLVLIEDQRQQAGVDSRSDLLQARLAAAQIRLKTIHLQSRATALVGQLAALTGLPAASIQTDPASIPEVPAIRAGQTAVPTAGIQAAEAEAQSKQLQARGDLLASKSLPVIAFGAQYNRDSTLLNNYSYFYQHFKADNFAAGFSIQLPLFDLIRRAKARESAAESLRATVEAEQAQRQNDVQIATLTGTLNELDALAEVASLKQEIAAEQLKTVQAELQTGNGAGSEPGAAPQLSPKAEQLARIDERQKFVDSLDAGLDLTKARLKLLRALGHLDDWLHELHGK